MPELALDLGHLGSARVVEQLARDDILAIFNEVLFVEAWALDSTLASAIWLRADVLVVADLLRRFGTWGLVSLENGHDLLLRSFSSR